jgi:hypothetical protein
MSVYRKIKLWDISPFLEINSSVLGNQVSRVFDSADKLSRLVQNLSNSRISTHVNPNLLFSDIGKKKVSVNVHNISDISTCVEFRSKVKEVVVNYCVPSSFVTDRVKCKALSEIAKSQGFQVKAQLHFAFSCPYEGVLSPDQTMDAMTYCQNEIGSDSIMLNDTANGAEMIDYYCFLYRCAGRFDMKNVGVQFGGARDLKENLDMFLNAGVRNFQGSVFGSDHFAVGTDKLCYTLESMGQPTGVNQTVFFETLEQT